MDRGGLGDPAFTRGSAAGLLEGVETSVTAQALSKRESAQEKIERFICMGVESKPLVLFRFTKQLRLHCDENQAL
jgi:hypothetical protein